MGAPTAKPSSRSLVPRRESCIDPTSTPAYFVTIIGFWKVLGAITLLVPRVPRLEEWAYAGIFFNMKGAATLHAASHDAMWHVVVTL